MNMMISVGKVSDMWVLVDPSHRFLHMFMGDNFKISLCGIPYDKGTYVPMHGKPVKHCPECEAKYMEKTNVKHGFQ